MTLAILDAVAPIVLRVLATSGVRFGVRRAPIFNVKQKVLQPKTRVSDTREKMSVRNAPHVTDIGNSTLL